MINKPSPGRGSPLNPPGSRESSSTPRSVEVAEPTALDLDASAIPVYFEPQPLVAISDHKTLELETIKLAYDIDPRRLPTQLSLRRPPNVLGDSGWPPADVVAISSQPPPALRRRMRAQVVVFAVLALALLLLARAAVLRSQAPLALTVNTPLKASAPPAVAAAQAPSPMAALTEAAQASSPTAADDEAASEMTFRASASPPSGPLASEPASVSTQKPAKPAQRSLSTSPRSSTFAGSLAAASPSTAVQAAPTPSKPKHSIY